MGAGNAPGEASLDSSIGGFAGERPPRNARRMRLRSSPTQSTVYVRASGDVGWGPDVTRHLERRVTWSSPPIFYLHEVLSDGDAVVSGADFNTYAVIRNLSTEQYYTVMGGGDLNRPMTSIVQNVGATIVIPNSQLEPAR